MENNYYQYLCKQFPYKIQYFDWIKLYLDNQLYHYGNHYRYPIEGIRLKYKVKQYLFKKKNEIKTLCKMSNTGYEDSILSNAYFSVGDTINKLSGIPVLPIPWAIGLGVISKRTRNIIKELEFANYKELLSDRSYVRANFLYSEIKKFLSEKKIKMLICYNDMYPLERMTIDAAKELSIPSVVYLHGLPGRYDIIDDNRADYLCVWGEKIKQLYIDAQFNSNKIIVTGHPVYSNFKSIKIGNVDMSRPLVLTYVGCSIPSDSTKAFKGDRGNCVNYPWCIEKVLKKVKIEHALLRPHPSESPEWYRDVVDTGFYEVDRGKLMNTLNRVSFVIGPISTVFLDAMVCGIPYFVFLPYIHNETSFPPPFDGLDPLCPVAHSLDELEENIKLGRYINPQIIREYIAPNYNLEPLMSLLRQ